ncbi:MAG: tyrosine-type recombinase/integrase [Candidatus Cloacimonetes bacterium]|nr:tyrosine-type recombinase/integrase [Candidatus Cloacimonadota bacterium]
MQEYITLYENYLLSKNAAQNTINAYLSDIRSFQTFCREIFASQTVDILDLNTDLIRAYLISLFNAKKTNRTISRNVTALSMFFRFLKLNEYVEINPMKKVKNPKYQRPLPKFFTETEITQLCEAPVIETFEGIRDKTMIELFYSSGLRVSELIELTLRNIDIYARKVTIIGKGSKKRIVPLTAVAIKWIEKYNLIRAKQKTEVFFLSKKFEPLTRYQVYYIVKKYIKELSLKTGYSPHTIRHSFATHMLNNGCDLYAIKEMLGHSDLATTEVYTHVTPEAVREAYLQGHPRAKKKFEP